MAKIENFLPTLLKIEGGYSNHPSDKGGKTKWGITEATFKTYYPHTSQSILSMTYDQAEHIYKVGYWDKVKGDEIKNQSLANLIADFAVNSGPDRAIRHVQKVLHIVVDGIIGRVTLDAINTANQQKLFDDIKADRRAYYENVVANNSSQRVFLAGWMNRLKYYQFSV